MPEIAPWRQRVDFSDPSDFDRAYRQHAARVRGAAQRVLADAGAAEDVAQEVFIRLWQRPQLFDPARGSLAALLSVMARSRALDKLRAEGALERARDRLGELQARAPAAEDGPVTKLVRRDEQEELRRALLRPPPTQRETVALAYGRELTSAEIARHTNVG